MKASQMNGNASIDISNMTCFIMPPKINSHGIFEDPDNPKHLFTYTLPLLELQMGVILMFSYTTHYILKRFGASSFVSFVITGIILGPTFLGKTEMMRLVIFPIESQDIINAIALFGYSMFLFLSAVKMDVGMILRTGDKALSIGVASVMVPMILGLTYERFNEKFYMKNFVNNQELFGSWSVMVMQSLTSFPVTAYLVGHQLKISNSELGRLGLSSALIAEILGILSTILISLIRQITLAGVIRNFIPIFGFVLVLSLIVKPAMTWVIRHTPERKPVDTCYLCIFVALALISEVYFHLFQQVEFLGPFIFGLAVPSGVPLGSAFGEKFGPFTLGVLLPILVTTSMMRADLWLVISQFNKLKRIMAIICVTNVVKFLASSIPSLIANMPLIDSMALALIMNYKGIVELCTFVVYRDSQLISEEAFAASALSILFNAIVIPILVKCLYDPSRKYAGYQARNIISLKPSSQLRFLACIHRPDHVDSIIRLLDVSYPTKMSPIYVHVLHLLKLVGRSTPAFISHSKQKPISHSSSQNVIHAFNQYEQNNWGIVSVETFTAISSSELMYEDICTLALDKLTSLILLPLHRKWSIHGIIESEDSHLRALNFKVLEKAPCSVGIFFDRGRLGKQTFKSSQRMSFLSLCVIFFGGSDDREALSLAKRMAKNTTTILTVVNFIAKQHKRFESEDDILDDVALENVKQIATSDESIIYKEHVVNDGPDTVFIVHSMANKYDLFLMGRRYGIWSPQTLGLSKWSELQELGIIGDFFASMDLHTRASVLVVQQQKQIKRLQ